MPWMPLDSLTLPVFAYLKGVYNFSMPQLPQDLVTISTVFFKFSEGIYFVATDAMAATWQSHLTSICISQGGV